MTIGRPLGQKIEKLVENKITEEEDCGCGTTEQNIHTSNKLTLKTAMQEGEETEPEIKVGTIVQAYGFPMVAGFKGENFYKIVGIDGDKVIFRRSNELGDTTNVGLKTYEVSMKAVKDAIKSVEGGGTSGLQIWDGGANLDEASNILVNDVNPDAVEAFLRKYPKIRTVILSIARKTKDLRKGYATFLKFKDKHENELGGRPEKVGSPTFGEKTFYKYDWMGTKGWAEVYQYLDGIKESVKINEMGESDIIRMLTSTKAGEKLELTLDDGKKVVVQRIGVDFKRRPTYKHIQNNKPIGTASPLVAAAIKNVKQLKNESTRFRLTSLLK
jgi:hypothetical protein